MKTKKEDLGKGIRALLDGIDEEIQVTPTRSSKEVPQLNNTSNISLEAIEINPFQPRVDFNKESLMELTDSIITHGVIQPITVRSLGNNKYQLIAGERRLRASKMAGKKDIPAYIRQAGDQEILEMALIENIQREDLNAVEIGINYKRLLDECDLTQDQLGQRLGKNRSTVTNHLRLLKLPPDIQKGLKEKKITMGHARAIIAVDDPVMQLDLYKEIIGKDLSVRKIEALVRKINQPKKAEKTTSATIPLAYRKIEDRLSSLLGTKVRLKKCKGESGELVVSFYSDDDLDRILEAFDQ